MSKGNMSASASPTGCSPSVEPASAVSPAAPLRPLARHTRGPWEWHWRFENGEANGSVFAEPLKGHAYAVAICPRYQKQEQWEADARLIAAAPDFLIAARQLVARWDSPRWKWGESTTADLIAKLRAAIAKAEGV